MRKLLKCTALLLAAGGACSDPPYRNEVPPAGILRGEFLYSGPPPCTENGKVVGAGVILVFDQRLLPPPDGLATRSALVRAVLGEQLFAEAAKTLEYDPTGARKCPAAGAKNILASAPWDVSPAQLGNYQIRAFYDYDGDFHPGFRFSNLPTKGDIAGGAIENVTEALAGQPPVFTNVRVGVPNSQGGLVWPKNGTDGMVVDNITVAVALPSPFSRPYFHVAELQPGKPSESAAAPPKVLLPDRISMPADYRITDPGPFAVQPYLFVMKLDIGLPAAESEAGKAAPFFMKLDGAQFPVFWYDANRDGKVDVEGDHVIGSNLAHAAAPLVSLQKLDPTDPIRRTPQAVPRVISSAITMNSNELTALVTFDAKKEAPLLQNTIYAAVRPTAVCMPDVLDANGDTIVVTPHATSGTGGPIIGDVPLTLGDIATLLRRNREKVRIIYACLPPGDFSINAINTTGQAWTLPNESGVCMPGEAPGEGTCGARTRLASQATTFSFGPADDPGGCVDRYNALDPDTQRTFRQSCLRPDEQVKLDNGTLWQGP